MRVAFGGADLRLLATAVVLRYRPRGLREIAVRIGVVSDSHDRMPALRAVLDRFEREKLDTIIHAGDFVAPFAAKLLAAYPGKVFAVYGNNDGERAGLARALPQVLDGPLWIELAGRRILVHHFIDWCVPADLRRADVVITGHTHQIVTEREGDRLTLNPGECCGWLTGKCSAAILRLDTLTADIFEVEG